MFSSCRKIFLEKASIGREFSPSDLENLAGLSRAKLYLLFKSAISLSKWIYRISKFQIYFSTQMQYENSKLKSLVLFITNFVAENLQTSVGKLQLNFLPPIF